jgi:hypothetical protein
MRCTNFQEDNGTPPPWHSRAVEEPSTASIADIGNSLSVPRGGNACHTAKQRHQACNLNAFERMHGILDLPAQPFVGATGDEPIELRDRVFPCERMGSEARKILNLVLDHLTVL